MKGRMTRDEKNRCHKIIHATALASSGVGAGLAQLPGSDNSVIVPLQIGMIIKLGSVFGMNISKSSAEATLATLIATIAGRGISQALVGWIPGFGNIINASTAAGVTEVIGWAVANEFAIQRDRSLNMDNIHDLKKN